jgi:YD repeat-containing protein
MAVSFPSRIPDAGCVAQDAPILNPCYPYRGRTVEKPQEMLLGRWPILLRRFLGQGLKTRAMGWVVYGILIVFGITLARADIQYVYDESGRLVEVVDTSGDSAHYRYDASGNIEAILRYV